MVANVTEMSPGLRKLLEEPAYAEIGTLMPDGSPQVTQVWIDTDGQSILVNTTEGRQKTKNVQKDPRVAINVFDPSNPWRIAQIRGRVTELTTDGAREHIDQLSLKYTGNPEYQFMQPGDVRTIIKIAPEKISEIGLE